MLKKRYLVTNTSQEISQENPSTSHQPRSARLKRLAGITASLALFAAAIPAFAATTQWWNPTPTITYGPTALDVTRFGAVGNGAMDDTAAFQAAINALPSSGGTIIVPDGTYMIDTTKGINLRSNMRLAMHSNAYLKSITNDADFASVLKAWNVNNVEIVGGHIVGERTQHAPSANDVSEVKVHYGISIQEANTIYVHNIQVADCYGDGILVGTTFGWRPFTLPWGITLNHVTVTNSARQGLSITAADQVYVLNSSFTGSHGMIPYSGIDLEPARLGPLQHVRLENNVTSNNQGNGVEVHDNISGVVVTGNTAQNNQGNGVFVRGAHNVTITNNSALTQNYLFGVYIDDGTDSVQLHDNTINYNGTAWFIAHGKSIFTPGTEPRDIFVSTSATGVTQYNNTITPK